MKITLTAAGSIVWKTALVLNKPAATVIILFFQLIKTLQTTPGASKEVSDSEYI